MAICVVSGTFLDPSSTAVANATVRFNLDNPVLDLAGDLLLPKELTTTTASDGTWSLSIIQGVSGTLTLDLVPSSNSPIAKQKFTLIIPSTSTSTFAICWVDSANFGGQTVNTPLTFSDISGQMAVAQFPTLPSNDIWVGNGSNVAAPVAVSGDVSLSNSGVTAVVTAGGSSAANIHSAELAANAATDLNTASTIVKRDASGNFVAGTIIASLTGHASLDVASSSLGNLSAPGTDGLVVTGGSGSIVGSVSLAQHVADSGHNGYVTSADWSTFNNKQPTITIGALDAQAANSTGISFTSNVLSQQSADSTHPGLVNNTTQAFTGSKTFLSSPSAPAGTTGERFGALAQGSITSGVGNTSFGNSAGNSISSSPYNSAFGFNALPTASSGAGQNCAFGVNSLQALTTGTNNVSVGVNSGTGIKTEQCNSFIGYSSGVGTTGNFNEFVGCSSGLNSSGDCNIGIGANALSGVSANTGSTNIAIGTNAAVDKSAATSNSLWVGNTSVSSAYAINDVYIKSSAAAGANWHENQQFSGTINMSALSASLPLQLDSSKNIVSSAIDLATSQVTGNLGVAHLNSGTSASSSTYWRGDATWAPLSGSWSEDATFSLHAGSNALADNTTSQYNIALGSGAAQHILGSSTTGDNIAIGHNAMQGASTFTANNNIAIGASSLSVITTGTNNVAVGINAGLNATTGALNTAVGNGAMQKMKLAGNGLNTALGYQAMFGSATVSSNTGIRNTSIGYSTMAAITSAQDNVALGTNVMPALTSGTYNTAIGSHGTAATTPLATLTTGDDNIAIGRQAGQSITTTSANIHIGAQAGQRMRGTNNIGIGTAALFASATASNNTGTDNLGIGGGSLGLITSGTNNQAIGASTLANLTTGSHNVALGDTAGTGANPLTTGSSNTFLGAGAIGGAASPTLSNMTAVGAGAVVNSANTVVLGRTTDTTVVGDTALLASAGLLQVKGKIGFVGATSGYVTVIAPATPTSYDLVLPAAQGAAGSILTNGGSGTLTWGAVNSVTSSSSGAFAGGAGVQTDITNLTCTITTRGRPVRIQLIPDGSAHNSGLYCDAAGNSGVFFTRGGSNIAQMTVNASINVPPGAFSFEEAPAAGTYTYTCAYNNTVANFNANYVKLIVREL